MSLHHQIAAAAARAPRVPDARFPTHDGPIWPNERRRMTHVVAIEERMIEDAATLLRDRGSDGTIVVTDFIRLGWTQAQIDLYGAAAIASAEHALRVAA